MPNVVGRRSPPKLSARPRSHTRPKYSDGAQWGKTRDPEQIQRDFQDFPKANIGLPTGAENGIIVIETDTKEGHENLEQDGEVALAKLEQEHGKLPDTLMAESPSGSKHRYFNHPGAGIKVLTSASVLGPGIDVRGDGGMVIAPPSVRKDGAYCWLNNLPIADAPPWLINLVTAKTSGKSTGNVQKPPRFEVPPAFQHLVPNQSLGAGIEGPPPPKIQDIIKEGGCGWLQEAYETGGKAFNDPQWYQSLRVLTFVENGHELAHQIGNQHEGYTPESTEKKWAHANNARQKFGWPSCKAIMGISTKGGHRFIWVCSRIRSRSTPSHRMAMTRLLAMHPSWPSSMPCG
jgi:hypothetical protein